MRSGINIRNANPDDIRALVSLEEKAFQSDRFNRSRYKYLVSSAQATVLVLDYKKKLVGVAVLLWHKGRGSARLYNIVIDPSHQGKGLGAVLLKSSEQAAIKRRYRSI